MGRDYDKILKENITSIFLPLAEKYLGFKIVEASDLTSGLQSTIEREPDFIKMVTSENLRFILQMEFQTSNDTEMVYRMAEYKAMLQRKYKVPVQQFVLYLGTQKPTMSTRLKNEEIIDGYQLKNIHDFDTTVILESFIPEEVILAILADYKKSQTKQIIKSVLIRLQQLVDDPATLQKYIHQLTILSRLRKLEHQIIEQLKDMSIVYDIEKDKLYREGMEKGIEKGLEKGIEKEKIEVARKLLKKNFSLEEIGEIVNLPVETIREISG